MLIVQAIAVFKGVKIVLILLGLFGTRRFQIEVIVFIVAHGAVGLAFAHPIPFLGEIEGAYDHPFFLMGKDGFNFVGKAYRLSQFLAEVQFFMDDVGVGVVMKSNWRFTDIGKAEVRDR